VTSTNQSTISAEVSIIPIGTNTGKSSISKEVAAAFDAIRKTQGLKSISLTSMGTQIEAYNMSSILNAIESAHQAVKSTGAKRIISIIHIDERLDESKTMDDKIKSVKEKLRK
jgi:uncharacterized protein (TIGR00106 family)